MYISRELQQPLGTIIDHLREDLHTALLYHYEVLSGTTTPYCLLKANLVLNNMQYKPGGPVRRTSFGLVDILCNDEPDRYLARTMIQRTVGSTESSTLLPSDPQSQNSQYRTTFSIDLDEKIRNVQLAITNEFKRKPYLLEKWTRILTSSWNPISIFVMMMVLHGSKKSNFLIIFSTNSIVDDIEIVFWIEQYRLRTTVLCTVRNVTPTHVKIVFESVCFLYIWIMYRKKE